MYSSSLAVAVFAPDRRPEGKRVSRGVKGWRFDSPFWSIHDSGVLFSPRGAWAPGVRAQRRRGRPGARSGGAGRAGARARACSVCIASHACAGPPLLLFNCIVILFWRSPFLDHSSFHVCFDVAHASVRAKRTRTPSRLVRAANAQLPGALQRHTYPSRVHLSPTTSARTRKHRQHRLDVAFYRA